MKIKILLLNLFLLLSIWASGQKSKMEEVWKRPVGGETIWAHFNYNQLDSLVSIDIQLTGINSRYLYLHDNLSLFMGTPQQFYVFLSDVEKFTKENSAKTSTKILGQLIMVDEVMGIKGVYIYDKKDLGYRSFTLKVIGKFKSKFVDWCKKNKVAYE